jgi:hypothetical protein
MNPFRALDDYVVPRLGSALARFLGAIREAALRGNPRRRLLAGAAALSVAVAAGATAYAGRQESRGSSGAPAVVRVGVVEGEQVTAYLAGARAELANLAAGDGAEVYALASFDAYLEPDVLPGLLRGVAADTVYARVPLPGVQTEVVTAAPGELTAVFRRLAENREAAAKEADWSANKLTGADPAEQELRRYYQQIARVNRAEARAYRRGCGCVYGAVVRGTPARLTQLAAVPGVRVVDPAPEVLSPQSAVFVPLLPEQIAVVTPPAGQPPQLPPPD